MAGEAIPVFLTTGVGPFTVGIKPLTVGSGGSLAVGSDTPLVGDIDDVEIEFNTTTEDIRPMSSVVENHVITGEGFTVTLVEILKSEGTNFLAGLAMAGSRFQVTITRGAQLWTFWGIRAGYNESLKNGKSTGRLTLKKIAIGAANPSYA